MKIYKKGKLRKKKPKDEKQEATLCIPCHNVWRHFPKSLDCDVCNSCKKQRAQCRNKTHGEHDDLPQPTAFADAITADHAIFNEDDQPRSQDRVALIIQDRFTGWLQAYASKTKNAHDTMKGFQIF